jgi:glycosyltransferase involved in cell wall biosynthesis
LTDRSDLSLVLVSTYPPTRCGIATFTEALVDGLWTCRGTRRGLGVVRLGDDPGPNQDEVVFQLRSADDSLVRAIDVLNAYDLALVQHEYGIFGGEDGDHALQLLEGVSIPIIVTLHTVLERPTIPQRRVLEEIVERADRAVVMAHVARRRLIERYEVDPAKLVVIPHGAHDLRRPRLAAFDRPTILTWGLIGPGKGIEWALEAMALLKDLNPRPRYLVRGETHPNVYLREGETYREKLLRRVRELGLEDMVDIGHSYLTLDQLGGLLTAADVVLCPYETREQVTSGVLVEAVAAEKPVVATRFPYAEELLSSGAGRTVPHEDPVAMAEALEEILTDHAVARHMAQQARRLAWPLRWPMVAGAYLKVAEALIASTPAAA